MDDEAFIREAIELAQEAVRRGSFPYGAVLVHEGRVVARAHNTVAIDCDVTAHAEINLLREATRTLRPDVLGRATLYSSSEPCAMCASGICWSRIPTVVYGAPAARDAALSGHPFAQVACRTLFASSGRPIEVRGPVLEEESARALEAFWRRMRS